MPIVFVIDNNPASRNTETSPSIVEDTENTYLLLLTIVIKILLYNATLQELFLTDIYVCVVFHKKLKVNSQLSQL